MSIKIDDIEINTRVKETHDNNAADIIGIRSIKRLSIEMNENVKVFIEGEMFGKNAKQDMENLRKKYIDGKPVEFLSNLTMLIGVKKIVIKDLNIFCVAAIPNHYIYTMLLSVYTEPITEEEQAPPSQEEEAEETVRSESEIDDIRGQILDTDGNPLKDITVKIKKDNGDEWQVKTDSDGYYEVLDVPEGKYEIIIEREGYEDIKKEVEISKGK